MEQDLKADASKEERLFAKVQAVREQEAENDAFQEERSFDRAHVPGTSADAAAEVLDARTAEAQDTSATAAASSPKEVMFLLPCLFRRRKLTSLKARHKPSAWTHYRAR